MNEPHPDHPHPTTAGSPPGSRQGPRRILIVTDGSQDSAHATGVAARLFPHADIEIMTAVPLTRDVYEGTTGFAGPVVDDDELTDIARSRTVAAMGATASTARALGSRPAHRIEQPGEPVDAILDVVNRTHPDAVVIASTGRGAPDTLDEVAGEVVDRVRLPVLVVPPGEGSG